MRRVALREGQRIPFSTLDALVHQGGDLFFGFTPGGFQARLRFLRVQPDDPTFVPAQESHEEKTPGEGGLRESAPKLKSDRNLHINASSRN